MSMFTRGDKPSDAPVGSPPRESASPAAPAPRAQATSQTLSTPAAAQPAGQRAYAPAEAPGVSVISKALRITGQLESTEDIRIDGEVDGDVRGLTVTVGTGARVKGTVYGDAVEVSGTVEGKIEAKKVVLTGTAHMSGDVVHQDVRIETGAFIDGHLKPEYGKGGAVRAVHAAPKLPSASAHVVSEQSNGAVKA